ncbi:MAG: hypothetical protein RR764_07790 [Oscillospiraceae bacterium]
MVSDEPSHTIEERRTVDIVAKKVGFKSGRQYERTRNVVNKIDKLKEQGNTDDAELLTDILNKAPSTAEEFISRVDIDIERLHLSAHKLYR